LVSALRFLSTSRFRSEDRNLSAFTGKQSGLRGFRFQGPGSL